MVQRVQRVVVAPFGRIIKWRHAPYLHGVDFITPSEPARSVGGTGAAQGAARRRLEPGRRRHLNPLAFRNTVQQTTAAVSGQPTALSLTVPLSHS